MKKILFFTLALYAILGAGCHSVLSETPTAQALRLLRQGEDCLRLGQEDSALQLWLRAADLDGVEPEGRYELNSRLARYYEQKNMFRLQAERLQRMLEAARQTQEVQKIAYTYYNIGVAEFTQANYGRAADNLQRAYAMADADSSLFRAQCQLMLAQVCLQTEDTEAMSAALARAVSEHDSICHDELFHLTQAYQLYYEQDYEGLEQRIDDWLKSDGCYTRIELLRLMADVHEGQGQTALALEEARRMAALTDSVRAQEASDATARIHRLQHDSQMAQAAQQQQILRSRMNSRLLGIALLLVVVVSVCAYAVTTLHRRARRAQEAEQEARRLADEAVRNEAEVREMNEDLQRRYHEHLYAILLPILNAKRNKAGHIDLNEEAWQLIEENTNMVLPDFAAKLHRAYPAMTGEDVRFCCLVMMKVPNPVIANIFSISPTSVSMRKQRMKKKMDEQVANETLEACLEKYTI
ncbi:MAG: hypothetical protein IJR87_06280 [Bacteroidaceae bacterium]|nr:hypothetical protein [Bacteroidaceae bacterium]